MSPILVTPERPLLVAANEAFDREFLHTDSLTDEDVREIGAEVAA